MYNRLMSLAIAVQQCMHTYASDDMTESYQRRVEDLMVKIQYACKVALLRIRPQPSLPMYR